MGGPSHVSLYLILTVAAMTAVLQGVNGDDVCKRMVRREEWSPNEGFRETWKIERFKCDDDCCGERHRQYCCPNKDKHDDDDDDDEVSGMVRGLSICSVIVVVMVVMVVVGCVCYRARRKRCRAGNGVSAFRGRSPPLPTVATTTTSACLPPSYELSITQPKQSSAYDNASPPSYEDVLATTTHQGDHPLPSPPCDKDVTSRPKYNQAFAP